MASRLKSGMFVQSCQTIRDFFDFDTVLRDFIVDDVALVKKVSG